MCLEMFIKYLICIKRSLFLLKNKLYQGRTTSCRNIQTGLILLGYIQSCMPDLVNAQLKARRSDHLTWFKARRFNFLAQIRGNSDFGCNHVSRGLNAAPTLSARSDLLLCAV